MELYNISIVESEIIFEQALSDFGGFWTSTEETINGINAYNFLLTYYSKSTLYQILDKEHGWLVRCLRDTLQFSHLVISDIHLRTISKLDFTNDRDIDTIIIINSGAGKTINVNSIQTNTSAYDLSKTSASLLPGDSIHLVITFSPPVKDIYEDTLYLKSDDPYDSLIAIPLFGTFPLEISITDSTNISCFGYSDGSATITPSLGTPPYQYQWDDPGNTTDSTVTGLDANIYYHVTVTDVLGWTLTDSVILSQPEPLSILSDYTGYVCPDSSYGFIHLYPAGGTPAYSYDWSGGQTSQNLTGLEAGIYSVKVTDSHGCLDSASFTIISYLVDSIIDIRDSQVYRVVKIGQQWWMQENLNIGTRIDVPQDATDNGIIEKYCYDDNPGNCDIYGGLYQWNEMMDYNPSDDGNPGITRGVCPAGWHLSTDFEWTELADLLGGESVAGGKLKEIGTIHWAVNPGATNESGFTALPGGFRDISGTTGYMSVQGNWWSSTELYTTNAWYRNIPSSSSEVSRANYTKKDGFSVRCLMDSCRFGYLTISDENFGLVTTLNFYGDDISEELILINSSVARTINISSIYTNNPAYSLDKSSSTLSSGDSIYFTITFNPPVKNIYLDTLFIQSDDPYQPLITIPLNGTFPPEISLTDSANVSCFGYSDGSATVTPSLGTPPYQYQWDDPGNTTDSIVTGLIASFYYKVTVTDSLGWSVTDSIILSEPALLTSEITDSTNI